MKRRSSPWQLFLLLLLVGAVAVGGIEYLRREQKKVNDNLTQQLDEANQKVAALKQREQALEPGRPAREALENQLLDASLGNYWSQQLMHLVDLGREANVELQPLRFAAPKELGGVMSMVVTTAASGSETQVQEFLKVLEEGKPLGWLVNVSYSGIMDPQTPASINPMEANINVTMYGP